MCFSATASFVTAGLTGAVGIASVARAREPREFPLAATPLFFAFQQTMEGLLWLNLPAAGEATFAAILTFVFLIFAEVFWPVYAPIAAILVEPDKTRRDLMRACLVVGIGVGAYLLWRISSQPTSAVLIDGHIAYRTGRGHPLILGLAYLAATGLPLILSSRRTLVALGTIILVGAIVAYIFYWEALVSVWCFFAAAASLVILFHFETLRRLSPQSPLVRDHAG